MVRWGILGTGAIANTFATALEESDTSELICAASRSSEKIEKFASKFNCIGCIGYGELINNKQVDAIYIATPHPSHFDLALQAVNSKIAVLCEKPITMNATETMVLIDAARKNKVLLMEAFMYKTHPQTKKLKELVREEFEGKRLSIEASFGFRIGLKGRLNKKHRLLNPELGGGSILDIGCYPLSMSRMIAGIAEGRDYLNPIKFEAKGKLSLNGIDLSATAELTFLNETVACIDSAINKELENSVIISDGKKSLLLNQPWHCGELTNRKNVLGYAL